MAQGLGHDSELRIELRAWTTIYKLSRSSEKTMQVGKGEASKFWFGVGVKIRIFYVMGPQDMEYWHGKELKYFMFSNLRQCKVHFVLGLR